MKFIWKTQYLKYVIVVILLLIILYFIYNPSLKEGVTSVSPKENCGDFTIQNQHIMNEITNANIQATGGNINAQINECISLINEINEYLPMNINDISVETVTQTSYGNENPSITIKITPPPLSSDAYVTYAKPISNQTNTPSGSPNGSPNGSPSPSGSPDNYVQPQIGNITLPTNGAKWKITANLPSGKIGETGLQGPNGKPGLPGNKGKIGPMGPRGKGGKDSTEGFSSGFNEPFNPRM